MPKTIDGLTVTSSAAAGDYLAIWRAANGDTRKITKANLIGATLTGAGTIATGGYTLTVGATSTINGSISGGGTVATGGYTGTLPATGTFSLLGTAQTYSALKTFSAGINLGHETLDVYNEGTWTPTITGSSSNPTVSYAYQVGLYTQIGNVVFYSIHIDITTTSGGSGDIRVSLPVAVNSTTAGNGPAAIRSENVNVTNALGIFFVPVTGQSYGILRSTSDNGESTVEAMTALANLSVISVSGVYFTNP